MIPLPFTFHFYTPLRSSLASLGSSLHSRRRRRRCILLVALFCILVTVFSVLIWSRYLWVDSAWIPYSIQQDDVLDLHNTIVQSKAIKNDDSMLQALETWRKQNHQVNRQNSKNLSLIPSIIHQTWKNDKIPDRWLSAHHSCKSLHPSWTHMLWTDNSTRQFLTEKYPDFLSTYDSYPHPIQRVDAARYFILYEYGGVYVDLDIGCDKPLDAFRPFDAILPKTEPLGFSNDLMMSKAKHPFFKQVIDALPYWNHWFLMPYLTVVFSTGPMFIDIQYGLYHQSPLSRTATGRINIAVYADPLASRVPQVLILSPPLYSGHDDRRYFHHYPGSSWHEDDAGFIMLLWGIVHRPWIIVTIVLLLFILYRCWKLRCTSNETLWTLPQFWMKRDD